MSPTPIPPSLVDALATALAAARSYLPRQVVTLPLLEQLLDAGDAVVSWARGEDIGRE